MARKETCMCCKSVIDKRFRIKAPGGYVCSSICSKRLTRQYSVFFRHSYYKKKRGIVTMSLKNKLTEARIRKLLLLLELAVDDIAPTPVRHIFSTCIVLMRKVLTLYDEVNIPKSLTHYSMWCKLSSHFGQQCDEITDKAHNGPE